MGRSRSDFHTTLVEITPHVYFVAPPNTAMSYPCIVYEIDSARTEFAGNKPYLLTDRYQVIVISDDADTNIRQKIAEMPMSTFNRHYEAENLHHYVFNVYF